LVIGTLRGLTAILMTLWNLKVSENAIGILIVLDLTMGINIAGPISINL